MDQVGLEGKDEMTSNSHIEKLTLEFDAMQIVSSVVDVTL